MNFTPRLRTKICRFCNRETSSGKRDLLKPGIIEDIEKRRKRYQERNHGQGAFSVVIHGSTPDKKEDSPIFSGKAEVAMRQLYSGGVPIPLVELGSLNGFPENVEFQVTMKKSLTYESKLSRAGAIGFRFRPDSFNHKIIFETYQGKDRTLSQHKNNRVIFSEDYNNLNNAIYKIQQSEFKNVRNRRRAGGRGTPGHITNWAAVRGTIYARYSWTRKT